MSSVSDCRIQMTGGGGGGGGNNPFVFIKLYPPITPIIQSKPNQLASLL